MPMNNPLKLALFNLKLAAYGNLVGLRVLLAMSSLLWSILTIWTLLGLDSLVLVSPTRDFLTQVLPQLVWAAALAVQGIAGIATALFNVRSSIVGIADRLLGATLWTATTVVLIIGSLHTGHILPPIWATHITMSALSIWMLLHTNDNKPKRPPRRNVLLIKNNFKTEWARSRGN